jgi:TRAP-type mannitol/chloroaromatic compound transport system permease small subunit
MEPGKMTGLLEGEKPTPSAAYLGVIRTIDAFTEYAGYAFLLLSIPLIFANFVEVISRYVFDDPTIWALDVTTMAFGAIVLLGTAPALVKGAHVRTDMLWEKFSDRTKGVIDTVGFAVFFLPTMAVLFYISIDDFLYALDINERSNSGAWGPALWPLRAVIPVTAALLFVQGISELMKSWWAARTGEFLVKHEKIEV